MPEPSSRRAGPWVALAVVAVLWLVALAQTLAWGAGELAWVGRAQRTALLNTAVWMVGLPLGTVVIGVGVAHGLARWRVGRLLAAAMAVPAGLTLAVVAVAWRMLFAFRPSGRSQVGPVNAVVDAVGLEPVAWLTKEPLLNTLLLCLAGVWVLSGLAVSFLVGAIRRVPESSYLAARDAGAGEWATLWRVVVPSIRVPVVAVAVAAMVVAVATYDIVQVATGGRFGTEVLATESVAWSFVADEPTRGSALALVVVAATLGLVGLVWLWRRRRGPLVAVQPVPRYRAEGRRARHSRAADDEGTTARRGRWGRFVWRSVAGLCALCWVLPAVGLFVTALRTPDAAASTGWWSVATDRTFTLDNVRTVLDSGMWDGIVDSLLVALPVALVAALVAAVASGAPAEARRATGSSWVLLAAAPVVAIVVPAFEWAEAIGVEDSVVATWVVQLVVLAPVAVLVASAARASGANSGASGVGAAALVAFLLAWNDQLVSTVLLDGANGTTPSTVRLAELVAERGEELHLLAAAALVTAAVPLVVLLAGRSLIVGAVVGRGELVEDEPGSAPDGVAGVDVEEVEPLGVDGERGVVAEPDAGSGLELGDAHGGAGGGDLVEGVGVAGDRRGRVDGEVDEDLRPE